MVVVVVDFEWGENIEVDAGPPAGRDIPAPRQKMAARENARKAGKSTKQAVSLTSYGRVPLHTAQIVLLL